MKFSEAWLRQWVNPSENTEQLAEQLTMLGLEVDSIQKIAGDFTGVVIGEVLDCKQHPNADKLRVCQVNVGAAEPLPIVCGAANVRTGLKVALATAGAVLPGNMKIAKTKLRGEPSHGMICSAQELGLVADAGKGILELPEDAPVGMDFRAYYQLDDKIIEIELTANRGDCLSIQGVAREVAALHNLKLARPVVTSIDTLIPDTQRVCVHDTAHCPRYLGRIIKGINVHASTPLWMAGLLEKSGIRCVHPVVDVCNYVMLELGQPMHGFDLAKVHGDIQVRPACPGEKITLLDQREVSLLESDLVIADGSSALAIAGVMGGLASGVSAETTSVFLESAFFDPIKISLTARRLGITSDASYRFERGVDFNLPVLALERATELLLNIVGGQPGGLVDVTEVKTLPKRNPILLRRASVARLLGIDIKDAEIERILMALGMCVQTDVLGWKVVAPSYRFDITIEVDLIEEVVRLHGYDNIPEHSWMAPLTLSQGAPLHVTQRRIGDALVDLGYQEIIMYSFVSSEQQSWLQPNRVPVKLCNPMASNMDVMRTSMWPGLLEVMLHNQNRQVARQRLFETGLCFSRDQNGISQEAYLGMLIVGDVYPEQWGQAKRSVDFYDMKGDIENLLSLGQRVNLSWKPSQEKALHPGQSADIYVGDEMVGHLGMLHPSLLKKLDLKQSPVIAELKLSLFEGYQLPQFKAPSKFPSVRRDLALVVSDELSVSDILHCIRQNADTTLLEIQIFDVYRGDGIEKGKKSIALGLTFQDPSRTLLDIDIASVIQNIIKALKDDLKATLRT